MPGIACAFDATGFASAFRKLHDSPELRERLGAIARSRALAEFDWHNVVDRLEYFYGEIIARRAECAAGIAIEPDSTG